jgi:hypothetical protein
VTSACFPATGDFKTKEVFIVLLIYTAVNIYTLKPAYSETACDGIFPVAGMFLSVQALEFRLLGTVDFRLKFFSNVQVPFNRDFTLIFI